MTIRNGDLAGLDATRCAALVRSGELTALELVSAAIVTEMYGHARETARSHTGAGIFAGVPFLVKDFLAEV